MDAGYASVARDSVAAALFGPSWIDESKDDEWERRYYTAFSLLFDSDADAWRAIQSAICELASDPDAHIKCTAALRRAKKKLRRILDEVGIDLVPCAQ